MKSIGTFSCSYKIAAEQKARSTYENILRVVKDPDVCDPIRYLREREIVHFQRFGEAARIVNDNLDSRNFYAFNPAFDNRPASIESSNRMNNSAPMNNNSMMNASASRNNSSMTSNSSMMSNAARMSHSACACSAENSDSE